MSDSTQIFETNYPSRKSATRTRTAYTKPQFPLEHGWLYIVIEAENRGHWHFYYHHYPTSSRENAPVRGYQWKITKVRERPDVKADYYWWCQSGSISPSSVNSTTAVLGVIAIRRGRARLEPDVFHQLLSVIGRGDYSVQNRMDLTQKKYVQEALERLVKAGLVDVKDVGMLVQEVEKFERSLREGKERDRIRIAQNSW